jgi:hypothetical protein
MAGMPQKQSQLAIDPGFAVEAEVRANVLAQRVGVGTVADLNLPSDFVARVADRAIRESYYERHRAVGAAEAAAAARHQSAKPSGTWASVPEAVPDLASFRSPETDGVEVASRRLVDVVPGDANGHREVEPRRVVRTRLAKEGLLATLARVILHLGPARFQPCGAEQAAALAGFGLPLDLLVWFRIEGVEPTAAAMVSFIAGELVGGVKIEKLEKALRRAKFVPTATLPGFRGTSESGVDEARLLRVQLARDEYYAGRGDGGCLDLIEGVLRAFPTCEAIVSVQECHEQAARRLAANYGGPGRKVTVCPQGLEVSQWAGDNGKSGSILDGATRRAAQLTPRFAGRREDATVFVPGDDLAVSGESLPMVVSRRSPLVFEGGNLLVCDDVKRGDRVLLVGEAELYRNQALGLTRDQAFEALCVEFGVQRCVVLAAASYHIDQEVTVRSLPDGRMVAFVPDVGRGVRLILEAGLTRLADVKRWPSGEVRVALEFLGRSRLRECLTMVWEGLGRERGADGLWSIEFANALSTGPTDSGVGSFHRFLLAADHLTAEAADPGEFSDGHFRAVLRSMVRREQDRRSVRARLEGLGWKVVGVPCLPEDSRGVNPLNGVQVRGRYLMPGSLGLWGSLDETARAVFADVLGEFGIGVEVISSGESQRRQGAVHCSVGLCGW